LAFTVKATSRMVNIGKSRQCRNVRWRRVAFLWSPRTFHHVRSPATWRRTTINFGTSSRATKATN